CASDRIRLGQLTDLDGALTGTRSESPSAADFCPPDAPEPSLPPGTTLPAPAVEPVAEAAADAVVEDPAEGAPAAPAPAEDEAPAAAAVPAAPEAPAATAPVPRRLSRR